MRPDWRSLMVAGLLCLVVGPVQAITLHRSSVLELHTLEAASDAGNDHPVDFIDPESLAQLLASLQLESDEAGGAVYLMSENQAIAAGRELARALARIDAGRDVHLVSYRSVGSFPTAKRLATGARVFVEGNRLNLIFGQVDEFLDEFREPYRKLARAGRRSGERLSGGRIRAADWFEFKQGRNDWVTFPIKMANSPRTTLRLESAPATPAAPSPPAKRPPPPPPSRAVAPAPMPAPTGNRWQDLEQGLETLQRLRDKGLITDQEFQAKRKALLDRMGL